MRQNKTWLKHIDFILIDIFVILLSYVLSFLVYINDITYLKNTIYISVPILLLIIISIFSFNEYSNILKKINREIFILNIKLILKTLVMVLVILWAFKMGEHFSRILLIFTAVVYLILATIIKIIRVKSLNRKSVNIQKTVKIAKKDALDVNYVYNSKFNWNKIIKSINEENIDTIVLCDSIVIPKKISDKLIENGISIIIEIENKYPFNISENRNIEFINNRDCLVYSMFEFSNKQYIHIFLKRLCDIVFGLLGFIINIPLSIIIKIIYVLSGDYSSIFYRQERIGKNGKPFSLYKYRTMMPNAEEVLKNILKDKNKKKEWDENNKLSDDPRITKIGKILRKTSLDEFPQFINILIGDMSLVGPRPLVKGELESHTDSKLYWKVKPGLTGWWGCNGRSNLNYNERLDLEYYYIRNYSLELDLVCIIKTFKAVFVGDGAK